jgi:hypothetical protein
MKITVDMMMAKNPCPRWPRERVAAYLGDGKTEIEMLRDSLTGNGISPLDAIWGAAQFLPDEINRAFAIWCVRQCKTKIPEIAEYINVIERYYAGKATREELEAAYWAADRAAYWAADRAAYWAADRAAYWAACRAACRAAYWAAYLAAGIAADRAAEYKKQIEKLIEMIKEQVKK